jgi:hypothetical protein
MKDNQIIKKRIVTNEWYRGIMAGIRLNNMSPHYFKEIPIRRIAITKIKSMFPLGTTDGIDYTIVPRI